VNLRGIPAALRAWRPERRRLPLALAALLLAGAGLAPSLSWQQPRSTQVVVLDITQSMNVRDQPADDAAGPGAEPLPRLLAAKQALRHALDGLPCGSKLGWAIFTEYRSYLLLMPVEVCEHRAELRESLAGIDGRMAWSGNSEVAKGLHSALDIARKVPGGASIVFVSDGHESPPLNPRHRPAFDDKPGEVPGLIVGVGGTWPAPIPKTDALGRPLGLWRADEVMQTDPRSQGRGGSVSGESLTEDGAGQPTVGLGATPGAEHLSSLREPYLQLLAQENGLAYQRLRSSAALARALADPALARPVAVPLPGRSVLGWAALALLLWRAMPAWPRRRVGALAPLR
jgi:mxaL protein